MATKSTAKKEVTESVKKAPVKKAAPAKAPLVEEVYVQFGGEEWKVADLTERAKSRLRRRATAHPGSRSWLCT